MIKSRHWSLKVVNDSSMTSGFYGAKRRISWMNSREKVSKSFNALLSSLIEAFMVSYNVTFVIDPTLRVLSTASSHHLTRLLIYNTYWASWAPCWHGFLRSFRRTRAGGHCSLWESHIRLATWRPDLGGPGDDHVRPPTPPGGAQLSARFLHRHRKIQT